MLRQTVKSLSRSGLLFISLLLNAFLLLFLAISGYQGSPKDFSNMASFTFTESYYAPLKGRLLKQSVSVIPAPKVQLVLSMPTIFAITPTFTRHVQKAELTRIMQTFRQVPNLHWIVVEDAAKPSAMVRELLARSFVNHTHLNVLTNKTAVRGRGFPQRNLALNFLRTRFANTTNKPDGGGVVYFADDDNVYDLRLFEQIRWIKTLAFGPVGLVGGVLLEKPEIRNGTINGWDVQYARQKPLRSDMAGFAFNLQLILDSPEIKFNLNTLAGYFETEFLSTFKIPRAQCEYFGMDNLTPGGLHEVLVWHTRTDVPKLTQEWNYTNRTGHSSIKDWEL